ncbi:protein vein isoform X1 [Trichogramma pretiosum]|uniref:protein vein isoform X1 n=1 Tax=Trichogramma pretiosum TaxID=7493 RepID=UPI000C7198E2|nr:protein vein isoform X1 [Trichogramma pretiosum]
MWSSSLLLLLTAALLAAATIEPDSIQATSPTQKTSSSSSSSKPLTLTTIDDGKSNLDYYGRSMIFGLRDLVGSDWSRSRRSVAKPPLDRAAKQQQQQMNLDMERYRRSMQQVSAGKSSPQQQQQQQQPSQQPKARNNNRTRSESAREQRRRCRLRGTCRGRNWCPDMDVGNRAYLAPTVFEGKARSMSSLRKPGSNYAVTFEVKRVYKSQAGFMPLQTNDSVRLHFRDKSGGGGGKSGLCQSVNSATTALPTTLTTSMGQGVAHNLRTSNSGTLNILDAMAAVGSGSSNGDDGMVRANIKRGKVYLVFVNRVGPRNFTILGEPVIRSKKNEQAIQAVLRPDYVREVTLSELRDSVARYRDRVKLVCRTRGSPPPRVHWLKDGLPLQPRRGLRIQHKRRRSKVVISSARSEDSGRYECVAESTSGHRASLAAQLLVVQDMRNPPTTTAAWLRQEQPCPIAGDFCMNGGTCLFFETVGEPACRCAEGFTGLRCETKDVISTGSVYNRHRAPFSCKLGLSTSYYC